MARLPLDAHGRLGEDAHNGEEEILEFELERLAVAPELRLDIFAVVCGLRRRK